MRRTAHPSIVLALSVSALTGCATTDCVGPVGNPGLTPARVAATQGHTGELQRWGGTLVETRNLRDSTELEVIGYPLDRCGVPRLGDGPVGRFIIVSPGYLETADYRPGRQVTATGLVTGTREGQVGSAPYRYPLLSSKTVRLWPDPREDIGGYGYGRPWVTIGIGGGSGGVGGGIGVSF
jgi:outer membrane lipoprotein